MRVVIGGHDVVLDDNDLVGEGGEARVYGTGADVVKIFHAGAPPTLQALRTKKLQALSTLTLPQRVVGPSALALDAKGQIVGYRMRRVVDAVDLAKLARQAMKSVRDQNGVLALFRSLLATIQALHQQGVVVGDCNDGNVVVDAGGRGDAFVIDADSMQVAKLPCPVAHERFLDPRLYGVSLVDDAVFSVDSDLYALRVLLFQTLCCVHPYGGTHAKLPTLLRRAEARHSVLRDDVTLPKMALSPKTLPDALWADFQACFDKDVRTAFDAKLLQARFVTCSCGVEHAQRSCPACQIKVVVPAVQVHGAVAFERIARGLAVVASSCGGSLRFVVDDGACVKREDGSVVVEGALFREGVGVDVGFVGRRTWLAQGTELVCLEGGDVVDRTSTGLAFGAPAFACSPVGLFRLHGDAIVHHDSGVVVGRALQGRTWLFAADDGCVAVWRAGNVARFLWCRVGEAARDVALPAIEGRVVDVNVVVDGDRALVGVAVDVDGRRKHTLTLLDRHSGVVATVAGHPDDAGVLGSVRGKILSGKQVLSTSARGLLLVDEGFGERACFEDTKDLVDDSVDLLRGSGGDVYVVTDAAIHLLRRRAATSTSKRSAP